MDRRRPYAKSLMVVSRSVLTGVIVKGRRWGKIVRKALWQSKCTRTIGAVRYSSVDINYWSCAQPFEPQPEVHLHVTHTIHSSSLQLQLQVLQFRRGSASRHNGRWPSVSTRFGSGSRSQRGSPAYQVLRRRMVVPRTTVRRPGVLETERFRHRRGAWKT